LFEREVTVMPKCKYPTHVKPYLKKIEEMALTMTEEQMAKTLGVSVSSWCEYKNKFPELAEAIKKGRTILVAELKSTLIMKARGYEYEESKAIVKNGEEVSREVYKRYAHPDTGAIHLLLKNLDDSWRNDDKETMELKKRQVDVQEKKADGW
jgi:hypothetical protein